MRIEMMNKNYPAGRKFEETLEKKLLKLEKYFGDDASVKVNLTVVGEDKHTMEITIFAKGLATPLRAEVTTDNMYENADILLPKIERQIRKFRTRQDKRKKGSAPALPDFDLAEEVMQEEIKYGKVVKVKNFEIAISSVEEAIEELELLDHNFYVFINADDNKVSILYRRLDDDYGLITPEY